MSVVIETTVGDLTVDLFLKERPRACQNFLKLCKLKYYNFCLFHTIQRDFIAQTGDPDGTGKGGTSLYGILYGDQAKYFEAEKTPKLKHQNTGTLSFASHGDHMLGSQFFVTLSEQLDYLDGEHCVFGQVVEGLDVLVKLNTAICDEKHQPYQDIRITHTVVLDDPLDDPAGLPLPDRSPPLTDAILNSGRIAADEDLADGEGRTSEELQELIEEQEARARATILEMVGDLPDADSAPPENVLFVCKLNPVTTDDDLQIIFSRFGKVVSCEIIRDQKTGNSLQYGFIEFDNPKSCENAYFKMDNVLIDDRRIHVDFSQSVSKVQWRGRGKVSYEKGTSAADLAQLGGGGGGGRGGGGRGGGGGGRGGGRGGGGGRGFGGPRRGRLPPPGRDTRDHRQEERRPEDRRRTMTDRGQPAGLSVGKLKALLQDDRQGNDDEGSKHKTSKKHKRTDRENSPDRGKAGARDVPFEKKDRNDGRRSPEQDDRIRRDKESRERRKRSPSVEQDRRIRRENESRDRRKRSPSPEVRSSRKEDPRDKRRRSRSPEARPRINEDVRYDRRNQDARHEKRRSPSPDQRRSRTDDSRSKSRRSRSPDVRSARTGDSRDRRAPRRSASPAARPPGRESRDRRGHSPTSDARRPDREERRHRSADSDGERSHRSDQKRSKVSEEVEDSSHKHKKRKHKKGDSDKKKKKEKKKRRRSTSSESSSSSDESSDDDTRKKSKRR